MLNKQTAQKVADKINAWAHQMVFDFVSENAHLPPGEFAELLKARIDAYSAEARKRVEASGRSWDDGDDFHVEALLRACAKQYRLFAGRSGRA